MKVIQWTSIFAIGLTPIFFLPLTQDFYETNKWYLVVVAALVILFVRVVRFIKEKRIIISRSPSALSFGMLALAALVSTLLTSTNRVEALLSPYGPTFWLALWILIDAGEQVFDDANKHLLKWSLYGSSLLIALTAVYQYFGVGATVFPAVPFLADRLWTPVGSSLGLVGYLFIVLALLAEDFLEAIKRKGEVGIVVYGIVLASITAGLAFTLANVIPQFSNAMLSLTDGWTITINTMKNIKTALVGTGAENFLSAFTTGRPASLNATPIWNIRFLTSATTVFHLTTIYGLLGLLGVLLILRALLVSAGNVAGRWSAIAVLLFLPPNHAIFVSVVALLLLSPTIHKEWVVPMPHRFGWLRYGIFGATSIVLSGVVYLLVKAYLGEVYFYQALKARVGNDGTGTYKFQIAAIKKSPLIARYHIGLADTSLALASALTSQTTKSPTGKDSQLTDADRNTAPALVQQGIREAKLGVKYAPNSVVAWEGLAQVYQNLIGVAQNAEQWAVTAYQKAIQLDPTNPFVRLRLGSVYMATGDYPKATEYFSQAVTLKPDYANAHYNLANGFRLIEQYLHSAIAYKQTLALIDASGSDRDRVTTELSHMRTRLTKEEQETLDAFVPVQKGASFTQQKLNSPIAPLTNPNAIPTINLSK